jgi:NAD+ diphosphatase
MSTLPPRLPMAAGGLDRVSALRADAAWVEARLRDPASRMLVVRGESVPVEHVRGVSRLALRELSRLDIAIEDEPPTLLGVNADGAAVFAAEAEEGPEEYLHLRDVAAELPAGEAALAAQAVALLAWHRRSRHCSVCGAPSEAIEAGHMRRCTNPEDGTVHHPRTDPCVIVLVHHGDRVLLGRRPTWPPGRFSVLAGFVEPGETLEGAVAREVAEESGVTVRPETVRYVASQPWPFPASLMLGFTAAALDPTVGDGDAELEEVRWFTRAELQRGAVLLPPPSSIARHLIAAWLGGTASGTAAP